MDLDIFGDFIAQVGFPVFVAIFMLSRLEPTIKELNKTITVLITVVAQQNGISVDQAEKIVGKKNGGN